MSYMAIGGSDITDVYVSVVTCPTTTGNFNITPGFNPSIVFFHSSYVGTGSQGSEGRIGFGAAISSSKQGTVSMSSEDAQATMDTCSYAYSGECLAVAYPSDLINLRMAYVGNYSTTGFTCNWLEGASTTRTFAYLAIKGGQWEMGNGLTTTGTTTDINCTTTFTPSALMVFSHCLAMSTQDTAQAHAQLSIGAGTSTSNRVQQSSMDADSVADAICAVEHDTDSIYCNLNDSGVVEAKMDIYSGPSSTGYVLRMDDGDPSQMAFFWVAVGAVGGAYELSVNPGSYSVSGVTAGTLADRLLSANLVRIILLAYSHFFPMDMCSMLNLHPMRSPGSLRVFLPQGS